MVLPRTRGSGGNKHPVPLGGTILEVLSQGDTWGQNIYRQYKAKVKGTPYTDRFGKPITGRKRPVGSYNYFMHYMHVCESLGLIARVLGKTQPAVMHVSGGFNPAAPDITMPEFQEAQFWHLLDGDPSKWEDPWGDKYPRKTYVRHPRKLK